MCKQTNNMVAKTAKKEGIKQKCLKLCIINTFINNVSLKVIFLAQMSVFLVVSHVPEQMTHVCQE